MIRKKMINKSIIKRLNSIESEHMSSDKPHLAIIGKHPDGGYEVSEHIGIGKGRGSLKYKSVRHERRIIESKEAYLSSNPTWTVILDDVIDDEEGLTVAELCKNLLFGDRSKSRIINERGNQNE